MNFQINPTKLESRLIKWLFKAVTKDNRRPTLKGLYRSNGLTYACDGHRLHMVNTPECLQTIPEKTNLVLDPFAPNSLIPNPDAQDYPDIDIIQPTKKPILTIAVNPKYLIDALAGIELDNDMAVLKFYSPHEPFYVESQDQTIKALVMPMHLKD